LVFVVGGLAWAYHLVQERREPAGRPAVAEARPAPALPPLRQDEGGRAPDEKEAAAPDSSFIRPPSSAQPQPVSLPLPLRVNQAIDRGLAHLRRDWCQPTAYQNYLGLLGLTLLECGVPRDDPAVRRIADLVRGQRDLARTYEVSLAILFLDRLGDPKDREIIQELAQCLLDAQTDSGAWWYFSRRRPAGVGRLPGGFGDNSNTQFAVLGLWVAGRHGVPVGEALRATAKYFRQSQRDDGSWTYTTSLSLSKHSMTCAGLFCLAAERGASPGYTRTIGPRRPIVVNDPAITRGFGFLGKACDSIANGGAIDSRLKLYCLWSLERVANIYGLETIGSRQWYPWTAELLLRSQQSDGSWSDDGPGISTCFALLILRRSNLTPDLLVAAPELTPPQKPTGTPGLTQPQKPLGAPGQPQKPLGAPGEPRARDYPVRVGPGAPQGPGPRVTIPAPGPRTKPGVDRPGRPPVERAAVYGPKQMLTLNIHIRNLQAWPDIQARLKALLDSPKGQVKLNTISGDYYWVSVAPVNGEPDAFARKVNFAKVVAVHMAQRLIYLDSGR
jgi:hypothetical protein